MTLEPIDPARVADAQRGDSEARKAVLEVISRRVYRLAIKLACGYSEEAADVAQETMVRLIPALPKLREPERCLPWAFRIATNVWREKARRNRPTESVQDIEAPLPAASDPQMDRVLGRLKTMDEIYRTALTLHYLEGLDYGTMSEILQLPAGTLRSQVARGLQILRLDVEERSG